MTDKQQQPDGEEVTDLDVTEERADEVVGGSDGNGGLIANRSYASDGNGGLIAN